MTLQPLQLKVNTVLEPDVLDCNVKLDLGVVARRHIRIRREKQTSAAMYDVEMKAMIILCGGKNLIAHVDPSTIFASILADVWTPARNPPPDLRLTHDGQLWLNVGAYMDYLHGFDFDDAIIKKHLNGGV